MRYTTLGHTDITIPALCLGGMSFGRVCPDFHKWVINEDDTRAVITRTTWESESLRCATDITMRKKYDRNEETDMPIVRRVAEVAEQHGVAMSDVALAWQWTRGVDAPIVGCSRPSRVENAVRTLDVELTAEDVAYLEELYVPHPLTGVLLPVAP